MSLIFNALQRFARAEENAAGRQAAKPAKRSARTHRRFFLSPGALLTLVGAIVITGLLAVQLVQSLSANAREKELSATPAQALEERPAQVATQSSGDAGPPAGMPGSASSVQITGASSPAAGSTSVGFHPEDGANASPLAFYPPEPEPAASGEATEPARGTRSSDPLPAGSSGKQAGPIQKAASGAPKHLTALKTFSEVPLPEIHVSRRDVVAPGMTGGDASLPTASKSSNEEPAEITTIESKGALSEVDYHGLAARAAYQLNVTQLSHRIAGAMESQDPALVNRLMKELEKTQGPDSLFLIRIKAYWQIQQNHLEKARGYLEQVLAQKPDDKESGMNLAVVEMRTGRLEPARRRLERLQRLYPEDDDIAVALQKLHP
jgi:Tetratricopeptide repeat